ncbi:MAG: sigma-70 family RNA polymerase sigma factor [Pseudomonadota bacterium]
MTRQSFADDLETHLPNLRAFARSLSSGPAQADDLVQETMLKAWANRDKFTEGTNLRAWLFTIMRNTHYSQMRKNKREVEDSNGTLVANLAEPQAQLDRMDLRDFSQAFCTLPLEQREALVLVGASGFSYDEAAAICGCASGTVKSRVSRARTRLFDLLDLDADSAFEADHLQEAAVATGMTAAR